MLLILHVHTDYITSIYVDAMPPFRLSKLVDLVVGPQTNLSNDEHSQRSRRGSRCAEGFEGCPKHVPQRLDYGGEEACLRLQCARSKGQQAQHHKNTADKSP